MFCYWNRSEDLKYEKLHLYFYQISKAKREIFDKP